MSFSWCVFSTSGCLIPADRTGGKAGFLARWSGGFGAGFSEGEPLVAEAA
jgi:hypothetical protein